jgi:hypothetical protein
MVSTCRRLAALITASSDVHARAELHGERAHEPAQRPALNGGRVVVLPPEQHTTISAHPLRWGCTTSLPDASPTHTRARASQGPMRVRLAASPSPAPASPPSPWCAAARGTTHAGPPPHLPRRLLLGAQRRVVRRMQGLPRTCLAAFSLVRSGAWYDARCASCSSKP